MVPPASPTLERIVLNAGFSATGFTSSHRQSSHQVHRTCQGWRPAPECLRRRFTPVIISILFSALSLRSAKRQCSEKAHRAGILDGRRAPSCRLTHTDTVRNLPPPPQHDAGARNERVPCARSSACSSAGSCKRLCPSTMKTGCSHNFPPYSPFHHGARDTSAACRGRRSRYLGQGISGRWSSALSTGPFARRRFLRCAE